jgi:hypothetical protein
MARVDSSQRKADIFEIAKANTALRQGPSHYGDRFCNDSDRLNNDLSQEVAITREAMKQIPAPAR